jgi:hypothetical protein
MKPVTLEMARPSGERERFVALYASTRSRRSAGCWPQGKLKHDGSTTFDGRNVERFVGAGDEVLPLAPANQALLRIPG